MKTSSHSSVILSTAKDHLSFGLALLVLVLVAGCGSQLEVTPTPLPQPTFPVVHVNAADIAQAVQDDRFFSDYGRSDLLISGTVASVSQLDSDTVVDLATGGLGAVRCDLGQASPAVYVGSSVTVESRDPERDASRDGAALMLRQCRLSG